MIDKDIPSAVKVCSRRGRRLLGAQPLTGAERVKRAEQRKLAAGGRAFRLWLKADDVQYLERLAAVEGHSASQILGVLITEGLRRHQVALWEAENARASGASLEQVSEVWYRHAATMADYVAKYGNWGEPAFSPKEAP